MRGLQKSRKFTEILVTNGGTVRGNDRRPLRRATDNAYGRKTEFTRARKRVVHASKGLPVVEATRLYLNFVPDEAIQPHPLRAEISGPRPYLRAR